jgi:uncharacterized protein YndB with AHSA1/START domain
LANETRRELLDRIHENPGMTLHDISSDRPTSRQAIMRHLATLESANLVITERVGREKRHYANPIPLQYAYDRWVDKYASSFARDLTRLKYRLEEAAMSGNAVPKYVMQLYIASTPEALWEALTSGDVTEQYYFGTRFESDLKMGAPYAYKHGGGILIDGEIIEAIPPEKLVMTFRPLFNGGDPADLNTSRTTFTIKQEGPQCRLTLVHDELTDVDTVEGYADGWARILSGLKTVLETGSPMPTPQPEEANT